MYIFFCRRFAIGSYIPGLTTIKVFSCCLRKTIIIIIIIVIIIIIIIIHSFIQNISSFLIGLNHTHNSP